MASSCCSVAAAAADIVVVYSHKIVGNKRSFAAAGAAHDDGNENNLVGVATNSRSAAIIFNPFDDGDAAVALNAERRHVNDVDSFVVVVVVVRDGDEKVDVVAAVVAVLRVSVDDAVQDSNG